MSHITHMNKSRRWRSNARLSQNDRLLSWKYERKMNSKINTFINQPEKKISFEIDSTKLWQKSAFMRLASAYNLKIYFEEKTNITKITLVKKKLSAMCF